MSGKAFCHTAVLSIAVFVLVVICIGAWTRAYAEERQFTCEEELARDCKGVRPGGGRILSCLKEHENDLSPACREKVADVEKKLKEAERTCAADTGKFCRGVQPGEGRIARCLKEHVQEISPECRAAVVHGVVRKRIKQNASEE